MTDWFTFREITESDFARPDFRQWFKGLVAEAAAKNNQREAEYRTLWLNMLEAAKKLYGIPSKEVRYLQKASYPTPSTNKRRENEVWKRYEAWVAKQEREARKAQRDAIKVQERQAYLAAEAQRLAKQRERAQDYRQRSLAATEALVARGFIPGISFEPGQAISFLKKIESEDNQRNVELEVEYRGYDV